MTDNNNTAAPISGEQRLKNRRRSLIKYFVLAMLGFGAIGFFSGFFAARFEDGSVHIAVPLAFAAFALAALIYFTWDYFHRIDELDLMDNLWAHTFGQYGALTLFMGWYLLAELDLTSYPTAVGVMLMMIGTTFAAYGLRKLGLR